MTTYFVTGGTGNIGAFVTRELARQGDQVVAYDLIPNHAALEMVLTPDEIKRTTVVQGDILDLERVVRTLKAHRVDRIAHFAAAGVSICRENPAHGARINVVGTNNMFEAALMTGVQRVLFASSGAVFGPKSMAPDGFLANDGAYDPQNVYGATKVVNEIAAHAYISQYGLDIIGVRPTAYGPVAAGTGQRWVAQLIESLLLGRPGRAVGGVGDGRWLYVEDMASAVVLALKVAPCPNTTLTLPIGFPATNDEVIELIRRAIPGASIAVTPAPHHWAQDVSIEPRPDDGLATELLGWKPVTGVAEGIRKIVAYHRAAITARSS